MKPVNYHSIQKNYLPPLNSCEWLTGQTLELLEAKSTETLRSLSNFFCCSSLTHETEVKTWTRVTMQRRRKERTRVKHSKHDVTVRWH